MANRLLFIPPLPANGSRRAFRPQKAPSHPAARKIKKRVYGVRDRVLVINLESTLAQIEARPNI